MLFTPPIAKYVKSYLEFCVEFKKNQLAALFLNNYSAEYIERILEDESKIKTFTNSMLKELDQMKRPTQKNYVPSEQYWLIDNEQVVAVGNLRFYLTEALELFGGHIGYGTKINYWGKGYGTKLLTEMLAKSAQNGIKNALLTCDTTNRMSFRVMEKNGGRILDTVTKEVNTVNRTSLRVLIDTGLVLNKQFNSINHALIYQHIGNYKMNLTPLKAVNEGGLIMSYYFNIMENAENVGWVVFRVANEPLLYYDGNVGYFINQKSRGKGLARDACELLAQGLKKINLKWTFITCDSDNTPSRRTCEKLNTKLLEIAEHKTNGISKIKCRYLWYL